MIDEFNTFEEYAKCVKNCLEVITHDRQMAKDESVKVLYSTAPIAYAEYEEHFVNGRHDGPLITFYQSGIETKQNEKMGMWKFLAIESSEGNYMLRAPIICQINYTVTINALTEAQADMLVSQIMLGTPSQRPYYTVLNGQYVCIYSDDPTNLSSVEVGENKDKVARREIKLIIERAYVQYEIRELNAGTINVETNEKKINPMFDGSGAFNYNLIDASGKVIGVKKEGQVKVEAYALDGDIEQNGN